MAPDYNNSDICSFCSEECNGAFRHVLVTTKQHEQRLKPILQKLNISTAQLDGYPTCDKCRRNFITIHNIPESCFQIVPSAEMVDIKEEPELLIDCPEQSDNYDISEADVKAEQESIEPEAEIRIKGENGEVFVISGLDEKGYEESLTSIVKKTKRRKNNSDVSQNKNRSHPIKHWCHICKKGFSDKSVLTTHMRWHTGEKPFKCETCGKGFCENSKLKLHIRTHTGERPFACPYCPKAFTQSVTLRIHIRIHTRETPYVCDYCDKSFTQSYNLTVHLRTQHNMITMYHGREVGIVPEYSCQVCNKTYRSFRSFKLHEKSHNNTGKLFSCATCGKKYTYVHKCKLKNGYQTEKLFSCHICGQKYVHQQSVAMHMTSKHKEFQPDASKEVQEEIIGF